MQPLHPQSDDTLNRSIFSTAKVAGIAAFISLAGSLAGIIGSFTRPLPQTPVASQEGFNSEEVQQLVQSGTYLSAIIALTISVLAFYFLFRFSSSAKKGIAEGVPTLLNTALKSLGSYFKIWGIIMFLVIAFFVLSLLGGMMGSLFGGK